MKGLTYGALKKLVQEELNKKKIKENNVSGGAGAYLTPKAFKKTKRYE